MEASELFVEGNASLWDKFHQASEQICSLD
jgi:hypothetical protein